MGLVIKFIVNVRHSRDAKAGKKCTCRICSAETDIVSDYEFYRHQAELYMFRRESKVLERSTSDKDKKAWTYSNQIYYYHTRLAEDRPFVTKDLEIQIDFFDGTELHGLLPVVLPDSPLLHAYVLYVHLHVRPHAGVELTMREILSKIIVTTGLRALVKRVRSNCTNCKRMLLRTIKLELGKHTAARTVLAPPFYNATVDIAMGFSAERYKNARKTYKVSHCLPSYLRHKHPIIRRVQNSRCLQCFGSTLCLV